VCSPAHYQELNDCSSSLWFYLRIMVIAMLCSRSGPPARPRTQHGYHHDTKVKPEAATAVIELLMMGGRTPETCWAINKCQDNKLENCCIWLVIYLNSLRTSYLCLSSYSVIPITYSCWQIPTETEAVNWRALIHFVFQTHEELHKYDGMESRLRTVICIITHVSLNVSTWLTIN
jgi:hypothetical protein